MTIDKLIVMVFTLIIFIICISLFIKTAVNKKNRHLPSALLASMGLGVLSLLVVWLFEFVCGKLISINLCTLLISLFGSLPAVAAMLFLNII